MFIILQEKKGRITQYNSEISRTDTPSTDPENIDQESRLSHPQFQRIKLPPLRDSRAGLPPRLFIPLHKFGEGGKATDWTKCTAATPMGPQAELKSEIIIVKL